MYIYTYIYSNTNNILKKHTINKQTCKTNEPSEQETEFDAVYTEPISNCLGKCLREKRQNDINAFYGVLTVLNNIGLFPQFVCMYYLG